MADTETNHADGSFWSADVDEAARRVARILEEERAELLTVYDERGAYGHPDHIQIHHVGVRAAEMAGTPRVYAATVSRQHFRTVARDEYGELPPDAERPNPDDFDLGVDEAIITTTVDVTGVLDRKRAAMAAHASQIPETSFFLAMPDASFRRTFGTEWFVRLDNSPDHPETWIFD
jgi:LmbE family N-acetylglucosaminyl deacetylase